VSKRQLDAQHSLSGATASTDSDEVAFCRAWRPDERFNGEAIFRHLSVMFRLSRLSIVFRALRVLA
jgi:hypothetical protein